MGKVYTPTYRVEVDHTRIPGVNQNGFTPMAWTVKEKGRATDANLEKFILKYGKSFELGGVNEKISLDMGFIPYPNRAKIIRQATNEVVATWEAPMFMVW